MKIDDFCIKFIENDGGGIKGERSEFEYIQRMYPDETFKQDGYSRSNGLIALSKEGMKELQDWSEGDMTLNLDEDRVENTVFYWYESVEEYNQERREWDDDFDGYALSDIKEISYDLGNFGIECIDDILAELYDIDDVCRFGSEIFGII